jgi:metal transporter CNNM
LPAKLELPVLPDTYSGPDDPFLTMLNHSGYSWVVLTNLEGKPLLLIDADGFLRSALFQSENFDPYNFCPHPVVITDETTSLDKVILKMKVSTAIDINFDGVIELNVLLVWGETKRITTRADIFGGLLKDIWPYAT